MRRELNIGNYIKLNYIKLKKEKAVPPVQIPRTTDPFWIINYLQNEKEDKTNEIYIAGEVG